MSLPVSEPFLTFAPVMNFAAVAVPPPTSSAVTTHATSVFLVESPPTE
jgi:hypothetical protein